MPISKRAALAVSLSAVFLYFIYQVLNQSYGPGLPERFSDLAIRIAVNKLVVLGSILLLLRLGGEGLGDLGVARQNWKTHLGIGFLFGFAIFVALNVVLASAMDSLIPRPPASGPSILQFFREPANLLIWLPIGILGGGVVEELQRIFFLTRFEKWLGRPGLIIGLVLTSAMFGFGHLYQGLGAAIATAVSGVAFALLYLRRRSAIEPIAAHAIADVFAMIGATMMAQ